MARIGEYDTLASLNGTELVLCAYPIGTIGAQPANNFTPVTMGTFLLANNHLVNSITNVGNAGHGLYYQQVANNAQFYNIAPGSSKVITTLDSPNSNITIDIVTTNININALTSYPLTLAHGGSNNAALTASNGGIVYSDATKLNVLSGTATGKQVLISGSNSAPQWTSFSVPLNTTINNILYSSSNNIISEINSLNNGVLVYSGAGVPSASTTLPSGLTIPGYLTTSLSSGNILVGSGANLAAAVTMSNDATMSNTGALTIGINKITYAKMQQASSVTLLGNPTGSLANISEITLGSGLSFSGTTLTATGSGGSVTSITAGTGITCTPNPIITTGTISLPIVTLSLGGTNANLTASNGGIFYSTATAGAILSGTATASQMLMSGLSSAPTWSTTVWPNTAAVNTILFASSANTIGSIAAAASGVLITSAGNVPSISSTLPAAVQGNITTVGTVTSGTWNGTSVDLSHGGTNASLTASNGGIFYSTATAGAILSGTATAGQILRSGSTAAPTWSTATYPATTTANQILYSSANNTISEITSAASGVLITSAGSVPSISSTLPAAVQGNITTVGTVTTGTWSATTIGVSKGGLGITTTPTNGQIPIGNGANYVAAVPTAGTRITVTTGSGALTITGNLTINAISGLAIAFASTTTITSAVGLCRDSTNTFDINLTTTPTLNFASSGANGLDTGAFAANSWYAIHVIADSTAVNPTALLGSLSAAAPTLPAGYDKFRRIGWVRTQSGSALIINFIQTSYNVLRNYTWVDNASLVSCLVGGSSAATFATLSLATTVPPTAQLAKVECTWIPNLAANSFYFRPTGNATTVANSINRCSRGNGTGTGRWIVDILTNSSQSMDYATDQVTDSLSLNMYSYQDSV